MSDQYWPPQQPSNGQQNTNQPQWQPPQYPPQQPSQPLQPNYGQYPPQQYPPQQPSQPLQPNYGQYPPQQYPQQQYPQQPSQTFPHSGHTQYPPQPPYPQPGQYQPRGPMPPMMPGQRPPRKSNRRTWIVVGVIVGLLVICGGISNAIKSTANSASDSTAPATQTAFTQASQATVQATDNSTQSADTPTDTPQPTPTDTPQPTFANFGDGTYQVGKDIQPGTYRTRSGSTGCYYERLKGFSGGVDDILDNANTDDPAIVTILASDKGFDASNCGTWTKDLSQITTSKTTFPDGMYFVGTDITPGTYKNDGSTGCYYARLSNFTGGIDGIIANNNVDTPTIVTISSSDKGFQSKGCGTWTKI